MNAAANPRGSRPPGHLVALGAVAGATLLRLTFDPLLGDRQPFTFFYLSTLIAAWYGGLGPGLAAAALGTLSGFYLFVPPRFTLAAGEPGDWIGLGLHGVVSVLIGLICHAQLRAQRRAEASAAAAYREQALLDSVLDNAPVGLGFLDADLRYVRVNDALARIDGKSREEILGRTLWEVLPGLAPRLAPLYRQVFETARPIEGLEVEGSLRGSPDQKGAWLVNYFPVRGEDGAVALVGAVVVDISDRKRVEEEREQTLRALRESEARFRSLLDANVLGILVADERYILEANDAFLGLIGHTRAEMLAGAIRWAQLTPPEFADADERAFRELLATGRCTPFEKEYVRSDGARVPVLLGGALVERDPPLWVCFVMDLTEQKRAEAALRQSEERYRSSFELAGVGKAQVDAASGRFLRVNRRLCEMLGHSAEELLRLTIPEITHPDDREVSEREGGRVLRGELPELLLEKRYLRKDGEPVWAMVNARLVRDEKGRPLHTVEVIQDITARKRAEAERDRLLGAERDARAKAEAAEQRASFLAEASQLLASSLDYETTLEAVARLAVPRIADSTGIDLLDRDGRLRRVATVHVDPVKEAAVRAYWASHELDPDGPHPIARVLRTGQPQLATEVGERLLAELSKQPSYGETMRRVGPRSFLVVPLVARDRMLGVASFWISESDRRFTEADLPLVEDLARRAALAIENAELYREAEEAREQLREYAANLEARVAERTAALRESYEQLEAFSYSVSHDLRAPLRAIQGYTEAILEDFADQVRPEARAYGDRIRNATWRMDALIQDLLAFSRLGRAELTLDTVELSLALAEALEALRPEIDARHAAVDVEANGEVVLAHPTTLAQVLANLISNALKFVEAGVRPEVRVRTERRNGVVRVWLEDNGIGIAPEHHERIFRVFERLHGGERYPGTGVGLAIVRKGVERMGGRVGLESAPGRGSRFWLELPAP